VERDLKELQAIIEACNASDDYKEGLAAIREKRARISRGAEGLPAGLRCAAPFAQ
jgi:hypothetical protein